MSKLYDKNSKIPIAAPMTDNKEASKDSLRKYDVASDFLTFKGQATKKRTLSESNENETLFQIELDELATSLTPLMAEKIHQSVASNVAQSLQGINANINAMLLQIDRKLDGIKTKYDNIDETLLNLTKSVDEMKLDQYTLKTRLDNTESLAAKNDTEINSMRSRMIELERGQESLHGEIEQLKSHSRNPAEITCLSNELREKMNKILENSADQAEQSLNALLKKREMQMETRMIDSTTEVNNLLNECRLESIEQYARRDCLMFFGLCEEQDEDTTSKVVETALTMGIQISHDEISVSHRLSTRNRAVEGPRPIIAKFIRRTTKNDIFASKHKLRHSSNHFNVFIKEHLTKERARIVSCLKKEGYIVYTEESRINYKKGEDHGVINSLNELQAKLNWDKEKMLKVLGK